MNKFLVPVFSITVLCTVVECANILAILPTPFYSHQATFRPLWNALAKNGHNVTLITTNPMAPNENITQIDISYTYSIVEKYKTDGVLFGDSNWWQSFQQILLMVDEIMRFQLGHPSLQQLKDPQNYHCDVILAELSIPNYYLLGEKLHCPVIGIMTMDAVYPVHEQLGNAMHPAIYSIPELQFGEKLSFFERLINVLLITLPRCVFPMAVGTFDSYTEEYIGKDLSSVDGIYRKLSMIIINANPIFYPNRPITPLTVNIEGGLQFKEHQPLPQDLQTYLDESKHGCIYFSFGSTVDSNYLTMEAIEIFRKTFEELAPIRVLWKFANDTMALKPNNVELRKWIPQHDILRHPNVKLFITQGGLQSMEEAVDTAVPMLGMPFYGDQNNNVNKMVTKEFGLRLDVKTMDKQSLKTSILELIENPKYKKNIARLSSIFKDRPMNALEKAVWWTEYVIRHGNTDHLRSPSADIPLYQYFFLDIIAFVVTVFIFSLIWFYYSFRLIRKIFVALFSKKAKLKTT